MLLGGALALAVHVAFTPPEVRGTGDCPSAAEVTARLAPLLPRGASGDARAAAGDDVELSTVGGALVVKLRDPNGDVVHERVTAATSCADRATELAVLVAIWEADLHTDVAFPPLAGDEVPAARSAPPSAPVRGPVLARTPAPSAPATPSEVSVGAAFSLAAPPWLGTASAGWLEATWTRGLPLHVRAALSSTAPHEIDLSPGTVTWRRVSLGLGALAGLGRGRIRASVRAGARLAALISRGSGFSLDQSATSWQLGADVGLRVGFSVMPRFVVWADVGLAGFPGTQRVTVSNVVERPQVPRWEAMAALGTSFSWGP